MKHNNILESGILIETVNIKNNDIGS